MTQITSSNSGDLAIPDFPTQDAPPSHLARRRTAQNPRGGWAAIFEGWVIQHYEKFSLCLEFLIPLKQPRVAIVLSLFALQNRCRYCSCNGDEAITADGIDCAVLI
jgi:hypothetical protein